MLRHPRLSRLVLGATLIVGLAVTSAPGVQAAQPGRPSGQATIFPFSGTATTTSTATHTPVPVKAANDLAKNEQTQTFAVRDATHWRVDMHVTAPVIDSYDATVVSDGHRVVEYSSLFNQAFRLPGGVKQSPFELSLLLHSAGAPIGTTAADYIAALKRNPQEKVRSLGQAQVLGRATDVVQISPLVRTSTGSCTGPKDCAKKEKGYGSATIWLDHQYGVVFRYEEHGVPKNLAPAQGYRYIVTSIAFGHDPSDADIAYVPPVAIQDLPQQSGVGSSGFSSGSGPSVPFQAPPGFIEVGSPTTRQHTMSLRGFGTGGEWPSSQTTFVQGVFRGAANQGFVYVKERIRALGLPPALTTGTTQAAGSCQVWTGAFPDGLRWLAMQRGQIAILVVASKLTEAELVQYAANGICTAPIIAPPSAQEVRNTVLEHLETEIDITRQILGWVIAAAPSAADKKTLKAFDGRLEAFDRTVFAIRHRKDPQASYSPPSFPPPPQKGSFADTVQGLKGEIPAAKSQLAAAESAVQSPADRKTLQQQGAVFDDLVRAVDAMMSG